MMLPTLTPQQSAAKWPHTTLEERSAAPCLARERRGGGGEGMVEGGVGGGRGGERARQPLRLTSTGDLDGMIIA